MARFARVVVVGAGFAGASFVRSLPPALRRPGETLLLDREEAYPFIPLIHEVAVGRVHPNSVRSPIAPICEGRCGFLRAEVTGIDPAGRKLKTSRGEVGYEHLVLTAGSVAARPPEHLREGFQLFWSLDDALRLRGSLDDAWQSAVGGSPAEMPPGGLTVAVVGGGATGVELAAEIGALFGYLKKRTARKPPAEPRIVLLEATDRLMGWLDPYFHEVAMEQLARLGVEVRLNAAVEDADEEGVRAGDERLPARVRVWATGIEGSPLLGDLPGPRDDAGRVEVDEHLTLPGHPEVYVIGDAGVYGDPGRGPLPPTASVAIQEGPFVARDLARRFRGTAKRPAFDFFDRGYVVSLGPEGGVADALGVRLKGAPAQALYRSIFLYYMQSRRDRILTGADWAMERTIGRVGFDGPKRRTEAVRAEAVRARA